MTLPIFRCWNRTFEQFQNFLPQKAWTGRFLQTHLFPQAALRSVTFRMKKCFIRTFPTKEAGSEKTPWSKWAWTDSWSFTVVVLAFLMNGHALLCYRCGEEMLRESPVVAELCLKPWGTASLDILERWGGEKEGDESMKEESYEMRPRFSTSIEAIDVFEDLGLSSHHS